MSSPPFSRPGGGTASLTGEPVTIAVEGAFHSIPEWFEHIVSVYGERRAVVTQSDTLTFSELNCKANRLARRILSAREDPEEGIALLAGHGAPAIVGLLGALKSGKLYVTLDPGFPLERLKLVVQDSGAGLLVCDSQHRDLGERLSELTGMAILSLDADDRSVPGDNLRIPLDLDRTAYLFYTSGSTGRPKGVITPHRMRVTNQADFIQRCRIVPDDRFSSLHSIAFSASAPEIYGALLSGAAVFPFDIRTGGFEGLRNWIRDQEISVFQWVASAFRKFAGSLAPGDLASLRLLFLGSEPLTLREIEHFRRVAPDECLLVNRYGATECGYTHHYFMRKEVQLRGGIIPIGYPVSHNELWLCDDAGVSVPNGEVGEICVRSNSISPGYWRDPERTRERFTRTEGSAEISFRTGDLGRIDPDGRWEHWGRKDQQVKIRGFRIETAEVEAAIAGLDGVEDALVSALTDPLGEQRLVAYVVPSHEVFPERKWLRRELLDRLPDFMVPSVFMELDALPLTPTGKLFRAGLPDPDWKQDSLEQPRKPASSPLESEVLAIWQEVLGTSHLGVDEDFFGRGGDSLRAAQIVNRVKARLGVRISPVALWDASTVEAMAAVVSRGQERARGD